MTVGTRVILGAADIAAELNVSRSLFSMWLARYEDTPAPAYRTHDGRLFWRDVGPWRRWRAAHTNDRDL